jgi:hypothetical protein
MDAKIGDFCQEGIRVEEAESRSFAAVPFIGATTHGNYLLYPTPQACTAIYRVDFGLT